MKTVIPEKTTYTCDACKSTFSPVISDYPKGSIGELKGDEKTSIHIDYGKMIFVTDSRNEYYHIEPTSLDLCPECSVSILGTLEHLLKIKRQQITGPAELGE